MIYVQSEDWIKKTGMGEPEDVPNCLCCIHREHMNCKLYGKTVELLEEPDCGGYEEEE